MKGIICEHTARTISNKVEILKEFSGYSVYTVQVIYIYIYIYICMAYLYIIQWWIQGVL